MIKRQHARTDTVFFNQLSVLIMEQIVTKFMAELNLQLRPKKVTVEISTSTLKWLAQKGFDEIYGARPLARLIQTTIRQPIAEELLFGKRKDGGEVRIDQKEGQLSFEWFPAASDDKKPQ